jgi:hypothetical protein
MSRFSATVRLSSRWYCWKTKLDALLGLQRLDFVLEQAILARPRVVQHAEDRKQRRLAGARRAHDRNEVAPLDLQVDAPQHEGLARLRFVDLLDVLELDHRVTSTARSGRPKSKEA